MKRDEKNQLTRRKILESACVEFASHGFEAGSVNTICQNGGVSKGIIYHYFSSKEELYLECVAECFDRLTDYMQDKLSAMQEDESDRVLSAYFDLRMDYFRENEVAALRRTQPAKAYFNCHTDITIPYNELGSLSAVKANGEEILIIEKGRFVLPGTEALNEAFDSDGE